MYVNKNTVLPTRPLAETGFLSPVPKKKPVTGGGCPNTHEQYISKNGCQPRSSHCYHVLQLHPDCPSITNILLRHSSTIAPTATHTYYRHSHKSSTDYGTNGTRLLALRLDLDPHILLISSLKKGLVHPLGSPRKVGDVTPVCTCNA